MSSLFNSAFFPNKKQKTKLAPWEEFADIRDRAGIVMIDAVPSQGGNSHDTLQDIGEALPNYIEIQGAATGAPPKVMATGSTSNTDMLLQTKGGGQVKVRNEVATDSKLCLLSNNGNGIISIEGGGGFSTGNLRMGALGSGGMLMNVHKANFVQMYGGDTGTAPSISSGGSDANVALELNASQSGEVRLGKNLVNHLSVTGSASAGQTVTIAPGASSGDTNCDLILSGKGTGSVRVGKNTNNFTSFIGTTTGNAPKIAADSSVDTNVALAVQGKGTGGVVLPSQRNNYLAIDGSDTGTKTVSIQPAAASADADVDLIVKPRGNGKLRIPATWARATTSGASQVIAAGTSATIAWTGLTGFTAAPILFNSGGNSFTLSAGTASQSYWQVNAVVRFTFDTAGPCLGRFSMNTAPQPAGEYISYINQTPGSTASTLSLSTGGPGYFNAVDGVWFKFYNDSSAGNVTITFIEAGFQLMGTN